MSSESPPAKRQRTEDVPTTRSRIWYKDGSVVLQAQDKQFRVHWSVLSKNSAFFRDMQDLPQPEMEQETVEGCPLIPLSDSVVDIEHLLDTLYNPLFNQKCLPFPVIASLVRLGRKYDFEKLLCEAVDRLKFEYPATLDNYDLLKTGKPVRRPMTRVKFYDGIHFDVITLARENEIYSVLPCAYYRSAATLPEGLLSLFNGIPRGDGTSATLSLQAQIICANGREKLMKAQFEPKNSYGWLIVETPLVDCQGSKCVAKKARLLRRVLSRSYPGPFDDAIIILDWNICPTCTTHAQTSMIAGRQNMWEALPGIFALPTWGELTRSNDL